MPGTGASRCFCVFLAFFKRTTAPHRSCAGETRVTRANINRPAQQHDACLPVSYRRFRLDLGTACRCGLASQKRKATQDISTWTGTCQACRLAATSGPATKPCRHKICETVTESKMGLDRPHLEGLHVAGHWPGSTGHGRVCRQDQESKLLTGVDLSD